MGEVNFYLKAPARVTGKSLIYLKYKYNGNVLVFTFGQSIDPSAWNHEKQRVKSNKQTTEDGEHSLNELLDNLSRVCRTAYKAEMSNGIPTPEKLREHLQSFLDFNIKEANNQESKNKIYELIDRFIAGEIKNKGKDKSVNTLDNYHAVKQHLLSFEEYMTKKEKKSFKITFDSINLDFFYSYVSFLKTLKNQKKEPISQNTIAKDIRILKVFMGEAVDLKLTQNLEFKHKKFSVSEVDTDAVYLSEKELSDLYKHDFSNHKKLEQVRDLFVFGSLVGLRFSDYSTIKKENIIDIDGDLFIKVITEKTKELVIIPCDPIVLEILDKYKTNHNSLPHAPSNQKFNEYIKEACEQAGLTEAGRLSTDPTLPLYDCISSHSARRSFATNLYLQSYPIPEIMKITGHKSEKAFSKYIRVTKLAAAKRLSAHMKKRWSEKMLKVA